MNSDGKLLTQKTLNMMSVTCDGSEKKKKKKKKISDGSFSSDHPLVINKFFDHSKL